MYNDYKLSLKIRNTYLANGLISSFQKLPLIGKSIHDTVYADKEIKNIVYVISLLFKIVFKIIKKCFYIFLFIFLELAIYNNRTESFITIYFFLCLAGGLINTGMFNPTKDKYYAMVLMKFNAKKYTLSNYFIELIIDIFPFIPFFILISFIYKINIFVSLSLLLLPFLIKNITNCLSLIRFEKNNKLFNENKAGIPTFTLATILVITGYILPVFNLRINIYLYIIIYIGLVISNIFSIKYIINYDKYLKVYKKLLTNVNIDMKVTAKVNDKKTFENIIVNDKVESDKKGYAFLNDVFVKKHKSILSKPSKMVSIIASLVFVFLITIFCIIGKNKDINKMLNESLPLYLIVMYYINRGQYITKTMFMNCDHSMLTYRTFRKPESILLLFKERLLTLIKLNIIPGIIIAIGSTALLYLSGGTPLINYPIFFLSIISMSIFFSIHYLVMYYLLQPYTINLDIKNPIYGIVTGGTYLVCYETMNLKLPTFEFGLFVIIFTIAYSVISLKLAYKYAPKTFKLRD